MRQAGLDSTDDPAALASLVLSSPTGSLTSASCLIFIFNTRRSNQVLLHLPHPHHSLSCSVNGSSSYMVDMSLIMSGPSSE